MAELLFFTGTMDSGKSTLALQLDFTMRGSGRPGRRYTRLDREGNVISSRIGLSETAVAVSQDLDLYLDISSHLPLSYVICDEAQFYTEVQIDQMARVVDEFDINVYAFGILSDFTGTMFPAARRLFEQADRRMELPVPALCWCGKRATHNARVVNNVMSLEGDVVDPQATYHVVCRQHFNRREPLSSPIAVDSLEPAQQ